MERAKEITRRLPEQIGIVEEADDRGSDLTVEEEVLLGEPSHDGPRVAWLVSRVVAAADGIEHGLWPGMDPTFEEVRKNLAKEGRVRTRADRA